MLAIADVDTDGNAAFFQMAKALIGETLFDSILAEAKGYALEGVAPTKNPTALSINGRCSKCLRSIFAQRSEKVYSKV